MKKKMLIISLLGMLCVFPSSAQTFRLGVTGGMNISSTDWGESKAGFRAGLKGEFGFKNASEGLFLSAGMLLSQQAFKGNGYFYQGLDISWRWDATPTASAFRFTWAISCRAARR